MEINKIYNEDCLSGMARLPDKSIDMILCDLPYGTTRNEWDVIIPFKPLWAQYKRIIKDNGTIVLTAQQPFASEIVKSNSEMFRYEWIWEKNIATGHLNARRMPMKNHENILIFYKNSGIYNPQMTDGVPYISKASGVQSTNYGEADTNYVYVNAGTRFPKTIQKFNSDSSAFHPTQKPVKLFEYLIKTYTNEGGWC